MTNWPTLFCLHLDMKKKENLKQVIEYYEEKGEIGVLGMNPYVSNGVLWPYLDPSSLPT